MTKELSPLFYFNLFPKRMIMDNVFLYKAIDAALKAGEAIMDIYTDPQADFEVERKSDQSPLTKADRKAHSVITGILKETQIPILSEEGESVLYEERKQYEWLWIVDPLDGTKEFIKRNGEFTVNIALIHRTKPMMGVVYLPVNKILYFGQLELGAYKTENIVNLDYLVNLEDIIDKSIQLPLQKNKTNTYVVAASRSHLSKETEEYINELKTRYQAVKLVNVGSSIKICWVAEGIIDEYPRFAPTMEWDTAAGHALILSAGKKIIQAKNMDKSLTYNKEDLLNPWFIVK